MKKPDYTAKVDALLAHAAELGFSEDDFADLAVAAADQSGLDARGVKAVKVLVASAVPL